MGVRGLTTFLEQFSPNACYTVNIAELAKKYQEETGKQAEIVIDAQSCYSLWYKGLDWVIGFEMQELLYRLKAFVDAFKKAGIKIVFFFGGLTPAKKRKTWISRRMKNMRDVYAVCDILATGQLTINLPERYDSLPPTMGLFTSLLLKFVLNCEVHFTVEECDEEIVDYAYRHDCFAIFGQDSDFIISNVKAKVLSSQNFNYRTMTTLLYDRNALTKMLNIKIEQLPLLAIVAGNDLIDFEILKGFHCEICGITFERNVKFDVLMPSIGNYIHNLPSEPIDEVLKIICRDLFGDLSELKLLQLCYDSYLIHELPKNPSPTTTWSRILRIAEYRHRNCMVPSMILAILKFHEFECSVAFEDLRRSSLKTSARSYMPSATVLRLLRQKLYGILFYEYENKEVVINEWCGENVNSYREPVKTTAIMPTVHHPGLLALWSDANGKRMNDIKWNLFLSSISPSITNPVSWWELTEDLILATASLYYLLEQKFYSVYEMYAVIATIATFPLYSREKLKKMYYGSYNPRATHISVCFTRTFGIVLTLMAACGYPVPMSEELAFMKFEAKLFQIKFKQMKDRRSIQELCDNDEKCINVFYRMKSIACRAPR